jgi:hypothetical protein
MSLKIELTLLLILRETLRRPTDLCSTLPKDTIKLKITHTAALILKIQ